MLDRLPAELRVNAFGGQRFRWRLLQRRLALTDLVSCRTAVNCVHCHRNSTIDGTFDLRIAAKRLLERFDVERREEAE